MAYMMGILLALLIGGAAKITRFDQDKSFYPTLLIIIASYYLLFAFTAEHATPFADLLFLLFFSALALVGTYASRWFLIAGLALHGVFDYVYEGLLTNSGVPLWWPAFCFAVDITLALWLACFVPREPITPVKKR